jgi:hypothetical protein
MFRDFAGRTIYYINQMLSLRITYEIPKQSDCTIMTGLIREFDALMAASFPTDKSSRFIDTLRSLNDHPSSHDNVQAFLEELAAMKDSIISDACTFNHY